MDVKMVLRVLLGFLFCGSTHLMNHTATTQTPKTASTSIAITATTASTPIATTPNDTCGGLCVHHPCKNGATCVHNRITQKEHCVCAPGWEGEMCTLKSAKRALDSKTANSTCITIPSTTTSTIATTSTTTTPTSASTTPATTSTTTTPTTTSTTATPATTSTSTTTTPATTSPTTTATPATTSTTTTTTPSTTSTSTATIQLPTSTSTHATTTLQPSKCYQCKGICNAIELLFLPPKDCPSNKPYCMSKVLQKGGIREVYKTCVDKATCQSDWLDFTSKKHSCMNYNSGNSADQDLDCHFCCTGDGCNPKAEKPADSDLYRP